MSQKIDQQINPITQPEKVKFLIEEPHPEEKGQNEGDLGWKWKESRYMGLALALIGGLSFAIVGLVVKYLKGTHVLNLGIFRFFGIVVCATPLVIYEHCTTNRMGKAYKEKGESIFNPIWPLTEPQKLRTLAVLFGRAFVGFAAISFHFLSIQYLPVADAMAIGSCSSVFVAFVAHIFLKERCGVIPIICALLTILGVGIISRPPLITGEENYNLDTLIGTAFALSRMMLTSVAIVFVRYLRGVNASLVVLLVGILQLFQCAVVSLVFGVFSLPSGSFEWSLLVVLGVLSFGSQMFLTLALKCEQAASFTILRNSGDVVFAFILQFIFLGVIPDLYSIVGSLVVISAVLLTVFRKWVLGLPANDESRIKYSFVLK